MDTGSVVRADSLTKIYRSGGGQVIVFNNLHLDVRRGERLAIIGESGAGKSTLLHILGGLDHPSAGTVWYGLASGSEDIVGLPEQKRADFRNRQIGFVWQNPSLLPEFTALENVMMPLLIAGVDPEKAAASARERLAEVGLLARAGHRSGELSGGEQQRVALARALVAKPAVLLADEPTGSLDFRTGESIIAMLNELHRKHELTSIFVTHNISFAARCDRVLELKKGVLQPVPKSSLQAATEATDATRLDGGTYV